MVIMRLYRILLLLPCLLFSAEFTASVGRNEVELNEGFMLNLTLKEASAKQPPTLDALKNFTVHSRQQSSSTTIMNGKASSTYTWGFLLTAQTVGQLQIPSIGIETAEGELSTQPITMHVTEGKKSSANEEEEVRLEAAISNLNPYKNEPFFLTLKLTSKQNLANLHVRKFEVEGAIVESAGEATVAEKIEEGVRVVVVEFKYLLTPLKAGLLKIPSLSVQGDIAQKENSRSSFDGAFGSFSLLRGLKNWQPFVLATQEKDVDVGVPVEGLFPWLPAKKLEVQENWDSVQTVREGEVFTRSFVITAEGVHSSQLPSLEKSLEGKQDGQFKVYADKPELKDEIAEGKLKAQRIERYSLIAQKAGELMLPEMTIDWWDTAKKEKRTASIPARVLQVLPAVVSRVGDVAIRDEREPEAMQEPIAIALIHPLIYILIGGLVGLLVIALVLLVLLQKKMKRLLEVSEEKNVKTLKEKKPEKVVPVVKSEPPVRKKREKLDDLNPT